MRYKTKTFEGFVGGAGSPFYDFKKQRFFQSQAFIVDNNGENLIKRLLEERNISDDYVSIYPTPTYNKYIKNHYFNYDGYQWLICYYDDTGTNPDYYGIKIFKKSSSSSSWTLVDTINGYDEIYGAFLFNDRMLVTANHNTDGLKTLYSDDSFSSYSTEDGASFDLDDDDVVHAFKDKMYKFSDSDKKLYETTDGFTWTEKMDLEDDGEIVQMVDDGSFLYLLLRGGKTKGRLYRLYSDYSFDVVSNFSNEPTDMIYTSSQLYITFLYDDVSFMVGEIVEDSFVQHMIYTPPSDEKDDLEIEDVVILFSDGKRIFFVPRWQDNSSPTVLYGDFDLKVKNRCIEYDISNNAFYYVHQLTQGYNFLAGLKNRFITSFLVEEFDDTGNDNDFYEYHDQNLKYQSSGEVETGDFSDGEMILKQLILRHDPLPANTSVKVYQKKDKASSWSSVLLTSDTDNAVKAKHDYSNGETCDFINFKIKLETSDNLDTPKNISLTLVYKLQGLEVAK